MPGLVASSDVQQSPQYVAANEYVAGNAPELGTGLDKFCDPAEHQFHTTGDASSVEDELTKSWKSIVSIAAETPFTDAGMQKLVDFVLELQSRPDLEKDGRKCVVQEMSVWQDLPTFGWQLRDAWNFAASDEDEDSTQQQWLNLNAWTASLVASAHSDHDDSPDFSLYGIWTVRSALEFSSQPWPRAPPRHAGTANNMHCTGSLGYHHNVMPCSCLAKSLSCTRGASPGSVRRRRKPRIR